MMETEIFNGSNVFLTRDLVPPALFEVVHDALKLNGANVFLLCDPSRNSTNDYHVISSMDHEMFEDLRSKGCNLIGPHCVLSYAKERKLLPCNPFTCCLAMGGVNILARGFKRAERVDMEKMVTAMGGVLLRKTSPDSDFSFIILKNVLARDYKWALYKSKKPIVTINWLVQCWKEHRVVPHEHYMLPPFSGLVISFSGIPTSTGEREAMMKLVIQNGGEYSVTLKRCTHLVCEAAQGAKYELARKSGHIHVISKKWFYHSLTRKARLREKSYPAQESSADTLSTEGQNVDPRSEKYHVCYGGKEEERKANYSDICWKEHGVVPQNSYRIPPFTGLIICITGISEGARRAMKKMVILNGGLYSLNLTKRCTHLVCEAAKSDTYKVARRWGSVHIISKKWFYQSISRRERLCEELYPVPESSASSLDTLKTKVDKDTNPEASSSTKEQKDSLVDQQNI